MDWAEKNMNWHEIAQAIQDEVDSNSHIIPDKRLHDIRHYLNHDEYGMAFEYLYLEIMDRKGSVFSLGPIKANKIGRLLDLDKETLIDEKFWCRFQEYIRREKGGKGTKSEKKGT